MISISAFFVGEKSPLLMVTCVHTYFQLLLCIFPVHIPFPISNPMISPDFFPSCRARVGKQLSWYWRMNATWWTPTYQRVLEEKSLGRAVIPRIISHICNIYIYGGPSPLYLPFLYFYWYLHAFLTNLEKCDTHIYNVYI